MRREEVPDVLFEEAGRRLSRADKIVLVGAGKGGVGKSLVSACLALGLADAGVKVGLLDLDVHGAVIPEILGVREMVRAGKEGLRPVEVHGIEVMSLGLLTGESPVPILGEFKRSLLSTMLALTNWGRMDYLLVDLPPGTGDEVISILRLIRRRPKAGALVVTTPSLASRAVVRRMLSLLRDEGIRTIGIVENMAYFRCGDQVVRPFGAGDVEALASEYGVKVLAKLPIEPAIEVAVREGRPLHRSSQEFESAVRGLVDSVLKSM